MSDKISYTYAEAAEATGFGLSTIKDAARRGDLVVRYRGSKPVIEHAELEAWVHALPATRETA